MNTSPSTTNASDLFGALFGGACSVVYLLFLVLVIIGLWKLFEKAGKPGWAAIIPIYNIWVMLEIVGRPGWWILLFLIPLVNFVIWIIVALDLAKSFGKDVLWGLGLIIFPYIFYLILGFGDATYQGPGAQM